MLCAEHGLWGIRAYKRENLEAMLRVFHEAVHIGCADAYTPEQRTAWAPEIQDAGAWDKRFAASQVRVAVSAQGAVLGFANLAGANCLDCLYVTPRAQGRGIGTALCATLEALAIGDVEVRASHVARPFFEHRGYRVLREVHPVRHGVVLPAFHMRLTR